MLNTIFEFIKDVWYWIANTFIEVLAGFLSFVQGFLPTMSMPSVVVDLGQYQIIQTINWLFPVSLFVTIVGLYIASFTAWFTIGIITRWAKVSA